MKKFKILNVLLVLSILCMMPIAYAHDIELDPDDIIYIDLGTNNSMSSETKVIIKESYGEYNLYYQYVKMDNEDYEQYQTILEEQREFEKENKPDEDATEEEIEEYIANMEAYEASKKALRPEFKEENWKQSEDDTVPFYDDNASTEEAEPYVLWLKLTKKDDEEAEPVYDDKLVLYKAPAKEETPSEEDKDKTEPSPSTGDNTLIIGALAVATIGLAVVSYKKSRA